MSSIFQVGDEYYAHLFFAHGRKIKINFSKFIEGLSKLDPKDYVIGLRLAPREVRLVRENRELADEESVSLCKSISDEVRTALGIKIMPK